MKVPNMRAGNENLRRKVRAWRRRVKLEIDLPQVVMTRKVGDNHHLVVVVVGVMGDPLTQSQIGAKAEKIVTENLGVIVIEAMTEVKIEAESTGVIILISMDLTTGKRENSLPKQVILNVSVEQKQVHIYLILQTLRKIVKSKKKFVNNL
jgi:hypothetical protein